MIQQALKRHFGYEEFRPGQREVVELLAGGQSAAAIFPTGAGKSLCYQLPAMLLPGLTLVVSPLLSLMKDQLDFLASRGLPAARLDSTMDRDEYNAVLSRARSGELKILMISVERFRNERFRLYLKNVPVSLLVVDEAHCISEWGHNFRPEYLKIPRYRDEFGFKQVLLLTATATPRVIEDMGARFGIAEENVVSTGFYRPNLKLRARPTRRDERGGALCELLARDPSLPSIVYVTQQKTAEKVAALLEERGVAAASYHAGLGNEQRERIQERFMDGELPVVCATIAFGMGVDKADIRRVVHYDLPKSLENYSQEIGRAGRDGEDAECTVLGGRDTLNVLENFVYGDTPERAGIEALLGDLQHSDGDVWEVRLHELAALTDIRLLVLKTLLVQLELRQLIESSYTYFEAYAFKFIEEPGQIAARFEGERRVFLETVFAHCKTSRVWTRADIPGAMAAGGWERKRIITALEYLDEKGFIELTASKAVEVYRVRSRDFDLAGLAHDLTDGAAEREATEIGRIRAMLEFFEDEGCLPRRLSAYFGEEVASDCGACSACTDGPAILPPAPPLPDLTPEVIHDLLAPLTDRLDTPPSATLATRYLCGITSPRLTKVRAARFPTFGRLGEYPFAQVKAVVERMFRG